MKGKPTVFLVCSGVGNINRGFESFTMECFHALKENEEFELYLFKGGGKATKKEIRLLNIRRTSRAATMIGGLIGKDRYFVEQLSFGVALLLSVIRRKPSVIYYSDFVLGTFLWRVRQIFGFRYKLLFSNGAPNGPPFVRMDHVQQLLPLYFDQARQYGTPEDTQTLLPYAIEFSESVNLDIQAQVDLFRQKLKLPLNKKIIISVGAVNSHHKRMDYVIAEFSQLNPDEFYLVLLGQLDESSEEILSFAKSKLRVDSYQINQVGSEVVRYFLLVSDYFILASLHEGLPRVLLEALSAGLLPIVHNYMVTKQTLHRFGVFKDLTRTGVLLEAIKEIDSLGVIKSEIVKFAYEKYSWNALKSQYVKMVAKNI